MFCQLMHGKDTERISADKDAKGYAKVAVFNCLTVLSRFLRISVAEKCFVNIKVAE